MMRRALACVAVSILAGTGAGCSKAATKAGRRPPAPPSAEAAPTPVEAAHELGRKMLSEVVLPADARPYIGSLPPVLATAQYTPAVSNLVEQHRTWTAKEPAALLRQFRFTPPSHGFAYQGGAGSMETPAGKAWTFMTEFAKLPLNVGLAQLDVSVTDQVGGGSIIRADALVSWTPAKPAAEYVPNRDRVVTVTATNWPTSSRPFARAVITDPRRVRALAATFNRMRLAVKAYRQECGPTAVVIPDLGAIAPNRTTYSVAFSVTADRRPDVLAVLWLCSGVGVKAGGRVQPTLQNDETFHRAVGQALHLGNPPTTSRRP